MAATKKQKEIIEIDSGERVEASEPIIISASRSTDIPAFYADWFMERWRRGYVTWINPFNRRKMYVSFAKTRLIVFWTKNPEPLLNSLKELDDCGVHYYFQVTLNDYENEGLEPGVPPLEKRLDTFQRLADLIGKERVIWRFDPLMVSDCLSVKQLLERAKSIGDVIHAHTEKLVFSYADIAAYRKVIRNLNETTMRELNQTERLEWATGLVQMNRTWNLALATCGEDMDLDNHGILHNKCVDDDLMVRLFSDDNALMSFIGAKPNMFAPHGYEIAKSKKDKGQRAACGCVVSKDIGAYNTCPHLCSYCYANSDKQTVLTNWKKHDVNAEGI